MIASWLVALWLGLIPPPGTPGGVVVVDALEVLDEPADSGFSTAELKRGDRVSVVDQTRDGWLAIEPPAGSFDWVDASAIRDHGDGRGEVVAGQTSPRSGADGARMPGRPRPPLSQGATVRLLDRPPLVLGQGAKARSWRAIAPLEGEVRYVRRDDVRLDPSPTSRADDPRVRVAQVETVDDPVSRFEQALRRSRALDASVEEARRSLAIARTTTERGYDARGLLQASSRKVDGQKVHALIGPEGTPVAYLAIPAGIPASRLLTRKVGVRGEVHFNESLGARLITVRDLDTLDKPR
jgi:hypothetical protein